MATETLPKSEHTAPATKVLKEASVFLRLSKDNEVMKKNVTPIEVIILCAEHQAGVKDIPVKVIEGTTTELTGLEEKLVDNPHVPGAKRTELVRVPSKRTVDQELDRLRSIYGRAKVKAMLTEVRDLPLDDFNAAISLGMKITLPTSDLSQTKLI